MSVHAYPCAVAGPVCHVKEGEVFPGPGAATAPRASPCGSAFTASVVRQMVVSVP